jgi:hypothetical protein
MAQPNDHGRRLYYRCPAMQKSDNRPHKCDLKKVFNARKIDTIVWRWLRSLLKDEKVVKYALLEAKERQDTAATLLVNRLKVIDNLIDQYDKDLTKKLDNLNAFEAQGSERAKAKILKDISQIESTLDRLEVERTKLVTEIESKKTLTDEVIEGLQNFALKIGVGLAKANDSLELRREAMETFNVPVTITEEDGQQVFYVTCMLQIEPKRFVFVPDILLSVAMW